jgi:hypothetical protein
VSEVVTYIIQCSSIFKICTQARQVADLVLRRGGQEHNSCKYMSVLKCDTENTVIIWTIHDFKLLWWVNAIKSQTVNYVMIYTFHHDTAERPKRLYSTWTMSCLQYLCNNTGKFFWIIFHFHLCMMLTTLRTYVSRNRVNGMPEDGHIRLNRTWLNCESQITYLFFGLQVSHHWNFYFKWINWKFCH